MLIKRQCLRNNKEKCIKSIFFWVLFHIGRWDILYPIKRYPNDFFVTRKYIVESDLWRKKSIDEEVLGCDE